MTAGIVAAAAIVVAALSFCAFLMFLVKEQSDRRCLDLTERLLHVEASRDLMLSQLAGRKGVGTEPPKPHVPYAREPDRVVFGDGRVTDLKGHPVDQNLQRTAPAVRDAPERKPRDPMYGEVEPDWTADDPREMPQPDGVV